MFGQDTVSYWYSMERAIEINNLRHGKLLKVREGAPNGEVYNIYCKGMVNCFDKYNDAEMVCMTVDGKIVADAKVKLNSKPERLEWLISTDSIPTDTAWYTNAQWKRFESKDTIVIPQYHKDTILVDVLCKSPVTPKCLNCKRELVVFEKQMERTLEKQWLDVSSPGFNTGFGIILDGIYRNEYKDVVVSTRWLDDITGCYQLIPLENKQ